MPSNKRSFLILTTFLFLTSCAGFKQEWGNFTAYYNTFYNAEQFFDKGYQAIVKGKEALNTEKPIRITEKPSKAGFTDFDKAIEKGAKILREYEKSKWVDDALFLIGKSYFYQMNYFSADEKFIELYSNSIDPKLKLDAVFWRARTFYETKRYEEALTFINDELSAIDVKWTAEKKAQVELIESEIYVELEDFYKANELLTQCLPRLKKKEYKAKGWYLKGQLLERLNQNNEALKAYSKVGQFTNEYSLQFLAKRKQAEIARSTNQLEKALDLYIEMSNDGKNYDIISDLNYEIGRTYQLLSNSSKAEKIYKELLYDKTKVPSKETAAKTYYGLAEIYRDNKKDLVMAAAYFDSAKSRGSGSLLLPDWFDADELAKHYSEFAKLHKKNLRFDSLLYLSTLTPEQLDSVIAEIQEQRKNELEALRKEQEKKSSTLNVVNTNPNQNNPQQTQESQQQNGFLNHKNPILVQQAKDQFLALWGGRPLVDNWRRADAIKNVIVNNENGKPIKPGQTQNNKANELQALKIDLSEIPIDSAKRVTFLNDFAKSLYETGNVFFLNLNQPDSALRYYNRIVREFTSSTVYPQTQFTISELLYSIGDTTEARSIASEVYYANPNTDFSPILINKYHFEIIFDSLESISPMEGLLEIISSTSDTLQSKQKAETYRKLSTLTDDKELAATYLQQAAYVYIREVAEDTSFQNKRNRYENELFDWEVKQKEFSLLKDSIRIQMKDSTIQADSILFVRYKKMVDSTLTQPDFARWFPYTGEQWDSSRTILKTIKSQYPATFAAKNSDLLRIEIELPESLKPKKINKTDSLSTLNTLELGKDSLLQKNNGFQDSLKLPTKEIKPAKKDSSKQNG